MSFITPTPTYVFTSLFICLGQNITSCHLKGHADTNTKNKKRPSSFRKILVLECESFLVFSRTIPLFPEMGHLLILRTYTYVYVCNSPKSPHTHTHTHSLTHSSSHRRTQLKHTHDLTQTCTYKYTHVCVYIHTHVYMSLCVLPMFESNLYPKCVE